ncbi:DUF2892 domain-containing protein [Candidatus Saganbacteria bacterium]|nr:DUF2892 domain-containing protein [Candidatus Saganbacteria bacterium]
MKNNESMLDRAIRVVVGLALVFVVFYYTLATVWIWTLAILAIYLIATGLAGYDWAYSLLNLSTKK